MLNRNVYAKRAEIGRGTPGDNWVLCKLMVVFVSRKRVSRLRGGTQPSAESDRGRDVKRVWRKRKRNVLSSSTCENICELANYSRIRAQV